MSPTRVIASAVRCAVGPLVYRKRLPREFGGAALYVTVRADLRLLYPGYERAGGDLMQVAEKYIRPGYCVWDIGSNVGIFAYCAAAKAGPAGKVFTVEADPKYAELQHRTSARLPAHYAKVNTLCAAVTDGANILELAIPKNGHARNHLSVVAGNGAEEPEAMKSVVGVTLDFLRQHWPRPDFLKIDVEGAELLALAGAAGLLKEARPLLYLETNESNRANVSDLLRRSSYRLYRLSPGGEEVEIEQCEFNTIAKPE